MNNGRITWRTILKDAEELMIMTITLFPWCRGSKVLLSTRNMGCRAGLISGGEDVSTSVWDRNQPTSRGIWVATVF